MPKPKDELPLIENPTVHDYAVAAEYSLLKGNPKEAMRMVSAALALEPLSSSLMELFERISATSKAPLSLFELSDAAFFGQLATHARVLAKCGKSAEALRELLEVVAYRPDVAYLPWAIAWERSSSHGGCYRHEAHLEPLLAVLRALADAAEPSEPRRDNALALAELLSIWNGASADETLACLLTRHLLGVGQMPEAHRVAAEAEERFSSWNTSVTQALVARRQGEPDEAIRLYDIAATRNRTDTSALSDSGELLLRSGQSRAAMERFAQVVSRDPTQDNAVAALAYAEWMATRNAGALSRLQMLAAKGDPQVRALWYDASCLETWLPLPESPGADALMDLCRRVAVQSRQGVAPSEPIVLRLRVTQPEPPSLRLAFARAMEALGVPTGSELRIETAAPGDGGVLLTEHPLWSVEGATYSPRIASVQPVVVETVNALLATPFTLDGWWNEAKLLRARLSGDIERMLLAAMVHPPVCPNLRVAPPLFVHQWQVAAALLCAAGSGPFVGSQREALLLALLRASADWTGTAALLALGQVAADDPEARLAIESWFEELLKRSPQEAPLCFEPTLVCAWMRLPGLTLERHQMLLSRRQERIGRD
jgi:tetratricopeptide (TPR) repeat protein